MSPWSCLSVPPVEQYSDYLIRFRMFIQCMPQNIKDAVYKWIQFMLIYVLFLQWRCLPADRQRRKLWHLSSAPASACVNLAVHLIVTSLELLALATAHGVGFNLNVTLLKCLQKVLPCGASLEIKPLCTYKPACHMLDSAVMTKEIVNFWKLTEVGVNNSCVIHVPVNYLSDVFNQGINKTKILNQIEKKNNKINKNDETLVFYRHLKITLLILMVAKISRL